MKEDEIRNKIEEIFIKQFGKKNFRWGKTQEQYKYWDSFSHMELISNVEQKFKIKLEIEEMIEIDSPIKLIEIIENKINRENLK